MVVLYAGEQWDADLTLYFNRARYLNVGTGRFWSQDSWEGFEEFPFSLHKYLYAYTSPANSIDPSGEFGISITEVSIGFFIAATLNFPQLVSQELIEQASLDLLHCNPDIIKAMSSIYSKTGNGTSRAEASFSVSGSPLSFTITFAPFTNQQDFQRFVFTPGTFAIFHVHPNVKSGFPSTPGNNSQGNGLGDTGLADNKKIRIYVVHTSGLTVYDSKTKKTVKLRENLDWSQSCKEKKKK